jgi:MFS family permease
MTHRGSMTDTNLGLTGLNRDAPPQNGYTAAADVAAGRSGFLLITLDILIVNVALPQINRELGGGTVGQQWVVDGYTLAFAPLLLFGGNLADRIGTKRTFGLGVALFGLTSVACALAPTIDALIAAQAAQGAATMMLPASMALIREAFPDHGRRVRALGVWAVGGAVALGSLLGDLVQRPLLEAIAAGVNDDLQDWLQESLPAGFFRGPPVAGAKWLTLVDGLDEVMTTENRARVTKKLDHSRGDTSTFRSVVATRPLADPDLPRGAGWRRHGLLPLDIGRLPPFAAAWFAWSRP